MSMPMPEPSVSPMSPPIEGIHSPPLPDNSQGLPEVSLILLLKGESSTNRCTHLPGMGNRI